MRNAVSMLAAVVALAACPPPASAREALPYDLVVVVDWGRAPGPESLRRELEGELVGGLATARCFRSVRRESGEGTSDLRLHLQIDDYKEETDFEYAISQTATPGLDTDRLSVAYAEASFMAEVIEDQQGSVVRSRSFRQRSSWRPNWHEDPREYAQRELVREVVRATRKLVCKGSPAKWSKQIRQARQDSENPPQR